MDMAPLLKVLYLLLLSDRGVLLVVWRGQKKWMADLSEGTGLDSGTESQRGTETGIETGIERGTEVLEVGGANLVMEGEVEVVIEWTEGTGSEAGMKMEANNEEEDGRETEIVIVIGTETAIGTAIEIEIDGTGGKDEVAWTATGNEGGVKMARGSEGGGMEEKEEGEKEGVEKEQEELKEKKGTGQGGQSGERGPHGGTEMIDWLSWKTWTNCGTLTAQRNLVRLLRPPQKAVKNQLWKLLKRRQNLNL